MVSDSETLGGSVEDVRAFCAVFELGSISAAARRLGTTKGGLSRQVSRLERRLGVKLLARTPRAVSPTEEGAAFYSKAHDALALLDEAANGAWQSQSIPKGHLRVTAPPDFGIDVLPPLIVQFQAQHPQITVELIVASALLDLAAQRIDLALRAAAHDLPDSNYRASTLIAFSIALYAAPAYMAEQEEPSCPNDLANHSIVAVGDSAGAESVTLTDQRGRAESLTVSATIRSSEFASALRLVEAGGGIGGLPDIIASPGLEAGTLVRVLPAWILARAKLHAISLAGHDAPARVRAFREFIRERLSSR
jgi:DNA-binding transcriptional LysR family regulator